MLQQNTRNHISPITATAERCAACNRELLSGRGTHIEYIGVVGPECVKKFAPLLAAIEAAGETRAHDGDLGSMRLTRYVLNALYNCGLEVKVIDIDEHTKGLEITGLRRGMKPAGVVQSYKARREQFELTLKLAAAEREAQAWVAA